MECLRFTSKTGVLVSAFTSLGRSATYNDESQKTAECTMHHLYTRSFGWNPHVKPYCAGVSTRVLSKQMAQLLYLVGNPHVSLCVSKWC